MRGRAYQRLRARLLEENRQTNQGRCTLQIEGVCTGQATQIHHSLGVGVTGHDPRYMQPACKECNLHVGDPLSQPNPPPRPLTNWS